MRMNSVRVAVWALALAWVAVVAASEPPAEKSASTHHGPQALLQAQRAAMKPFADMAGIWRGKATVSLPSGRQFSMSHSERVGPFLGGTLMVMEGRSHDSDGTLRFNALGIISYAPDDKSYTMRSYAQGHAGNFTLKPTAEGFEWSFVSTMGSKPMLTHFVATIKDGVWHEVGTRALGPAEPVKFFEMTLHRVGDSDWPAAGALPFKPASGMRTSARKN